MRFFTLYKFELKKILFMVFPAIFIIYFLGVLELDSALNNYFINGCLNPYNDLNLTAEMSPFNLVWVVIMAFVQFKSFSLKERGSLPFSQSSVFLAYFLSGATIIGAAVLFYTVFGGGDLVKYSFLLEVQQNSVSSPMAYIGGFGLFLLNTFSIFLIMLAAYLTAIIFMVLFKNPVFSTVIWFMFFGFFTEVCEDTSFSLLVLNPLGWLSDYNSIGCYLNIFSGFVKAPSSAFYVLQELKLIYLICAFFMLYSIASLSFFAVKDKGKYLFSKNIFGDIIIFLTVVFISFTIMYSSFYNYYTSTAPNTIMIAVMSVILGAAAETATIIFNKGGRKNEK